MVALPNLAECMILVLTRWDCLLLMLSCLYLVFNNFKLLSFAVFPDQIQCHQICHWSLCVHFLLLFRGAAQHNLRKRFGLNKEFFFLLTIPTRLGNNWLDVRPTDTKIEGIFHFGSFLHQMWVWYKRRGGRCPWVGFRVILCKQMSFSSPRWKIKRKKAHLSTQQLNMAWTHKFWKHTKQRSFTSWLGKSKCVNAAENINIQHM